MKTYLEFRANRFPAYENEEQEINPEIYGKRLAEFLSTGLCSLGFETGDLIAEDWGWVIPVKNDGFKLWIGCANYEYSDGFLCFIEPHKPVLHRMFKKIDAKPRIEALQKAMDDALSESAGIRDKHWRTYEEFNKP